MTMLGTPRSEDEPMENVHGRKIRVAVIGLGLIGPRHVSTVVEEDTTVLCAIVDPDPAAREYAAVRSVPYYQTVSDLISSTDRPDGAIVCTPNHTHVPIASELVAAGINVLVEKPISTDIASAWRLVDKAKNSGVHLLVGHHRRFNPYVSAAKGVLKDRTLGSIIAINGLWMMYKPLEYFTAAPWRQSPQGGVFLINMIHEIDILQYLLGPITRVYAEKIVSHRGFEAEEGAAITLRFDNGCVGTFLVGDHSPSPYSFEAGTGENPLIHRTGKTFLQIFGTDGSLCVPELGVSKYPESVQKSWHSRLEEVELDNTNHELPFKSQLRNFVEVIRGEDEPVCTGEDGVDALIVCEALRKSLSTEQPVTIERRAGP